jgi:hypothetical protein
LLLPDWTEANPSSNPEPPVEATPFATIPAASVVAKQFVIVDVTAQVKSWLETPASDFGIAIKSDATARVLVSAKEGPAAGYPAELEIEARRSLKMINLGHRSIRPVRLRICRRPQNWPTWMGVMGPLQSQINN